MVLQCAGSACSRAWCAITLAGSWCSNPSITACQTLLILIPEKSEDYDGFFPNILKGEMLKP